MGGRGLRDEALWAKFLHSPGWQSCHPSQQLCFCLLNLLMLQPEIGGESRAPPGAPAAEPQEVLRCCWKHQYQQDLQPPQRDRPELIHLGWVTECLGNVDGKEGISSTPQKHINTKLARWFCLLRGSEVHGEVECGDTLSSCRLAGRMDESLCGLKKKTVSVEPKLGSVFWIDPAQRQRFLPGMLFFFFSPPFFGNCKSVWLWHSSRHIALSQHPCCTLAFSSGLSEIIIPRASLALKGKSAVTIQLRS